MENQTNFIIKEEIKKQGRTAKWIGEQLGISETAISLRLKGKTNFKYEEISKIKELLNLPDDWFGLSESQELTALQMFYSGTEDISKIAEGVNATFEQVSSMIIHELNKKEKESFKN